MIRYAVSINNGIEHKYVNTMRKLLLTTCCTNRHTNKLSRTGGKDLKITFTMKSFTLNQSYFLNKYTLMSIHITSMVNIIIAIKFKDVPIFKQIHAIGMMSSLGVYV